MTRVISAIVGVVATLFGLVISPALVPAASAGTAQGYTYDGHYQSGVSTYTAAERAPPAAQRHDTSYDVIAHRSAGASARASGPTTRPAYDYDDIALLAQSDNIRFATAEPAVAISGDFLALERSRVAAKSGTSALESLSPAIRTNVDDAIERAASGKIRFTGHDGKVYNNSDDLLARGGNYTEWTAAQAGAKRGADRVIIEGDPANPNAIYYWDHVNPPVRIGP